jgi:alpha-tubulin suppressor-like RCC1 family protein
MGGAFHYFAANANGEVFAWGRNDEGRLGLGHAAAVPLAPSLVSDLEGVSLGAGRGGGHHSIAIAGFGSGRATFTNSYDVIEPTQASALLTKVLQQPASIASSNRSFTFNATRHSFNGDTALASQLPQLGTNGTFTLNMSAGTADVNTTTGITTITHSAELLAGIDFLNPGTYVWRITEVDGSSNTTAPSSVTYSQAVYELRVEVTQTRPGAPVQAVATVTRLVDDAGDVVTDIVGGFPLWSWGYNVNRELGRPGGVADPVHTPHMIGTQTDWVYCATAEGGSYAINASGELYAWGAAWNLNQMGQGGTQPNADYLVGANIAEPVRVGQASDWVSVSARRVNVAAINESGELFTWGESWTGGTNVPTQVAPNTTWASVVVGNRHILALSDEGYIYSWGRGESDAERTALGRSINTIPAGTPGRIPGSGWTSVSASTNYGFAINERGQLFSWGSNTGKIGRATADTGQAGRPYQVGRMSNWVDVRATNNAVVGLTSRGELWSWGHTAADNLPQLGRAVTANAPANRPARIGTATNWVSIMGGAQHFLAFNDEGRLYGWGNNSAGQLGIGFTGPLVDTPTFVLEVRNFSSAARGGGGHSIMLLGAQEATFTNTYSRATQLIKTLEVQGVAANLTQDFGISVTMTPTPFCAPNKTFTARIYDANNTFLREEVFEAGVARTINMRHDHRADFGTQPIGTGFYFTKLAHPDFRSEVELDKNGNRVFEQRNAAVNTSVTSGANRLTIDNSNHAHFIAIHQDPPFTGLDTGDVFWMILLLIAVVTAAGIVTKKTLSKPVALSASAAKVAGSDNA